MSKSWLIDAHNLLHQFPSLLRAYERDRREGVEQLALLVEQHCERHGYKAELIFDGHPVHTTLHSQWCSIAFSRDQTADERIRKLLFRTNARRRWIVVSDDNEILGTAENLGVPARKASSFAADAGSNRPETDPEDRLPYKHGQEEVPDSEVQLMLKKFREQQSGDDA